MDKRTPSLRGEVLGADTTGPAVVRVGTIQLNVTNLLFESRKALFCVLVQDTSRKQLKTLQQQEEHERRALTEFSLQVGATREVEAEPAAGNQGGDRGEIDRLGWVMMLLPSKISVNFLLPTRSTSSRCISQTEMEGTGYSREAESW